MKPAKPEEIQTRARASQSTQTATLAEIARQAGVSAPTVSKVLNGRADVAPATRTRVEELLREYGYRRRRAEASRSPLIDLVFHELESAWAMEVIRGVENIAREEGLSVVLSESAGRLTPGRTWADQVAARRPHGVVLVLSGLDESQRALLTSRSIPFVVMDPAGDPGDDVPSIGATNWQGGLAATRHLVELGHRRIGAISGPSRMICSRARVDGYRAALETAGLPVAADLIKAGDFHHETGYRLGLELLRRPDRPTAVFAGNDLQALGLYEAARELGLRIPEDLSVVGFDDLPVARWVGPPLTTVRQPLMKMAEAAARLVLDLGRQDTPPTATRVELATTLVVRSSTTAPPAS
ncbi:MULTISPECIES: LacI family DNA-binding transcriptional regulator [Streptomyces]|uniref:Putative transcriptional regulator n=1 Tax=Streptomyces scabiei (strain 87.22) TaxID=680198 RepID=C9YUZ3_STRSW|nr:MULTISPECIES: LacI family DNA-binding transcriptional regulator [Streptomyces]MBP5861727.1 LacI family transcriptional regulator [Streptomyces sp. LBUM 1484]MBP5869341.1 LacI family transcriptional regulator [Streptomyces sp. LBUM 1485]MBP5907784.1 LacI family transcriptional regulator [Streptomyces sp. LBUM 1478]MBP5929283.1 LacI family transcriptional regulator [Streptomyces sp. LBUM 1479]KFG06101.1 LacI family transcriptional regulator [Streptomyces scabiei]